MANDYEDESSKEMLYDLRQIFAKEIIGMTLREIARARKFNDYQNWYQLLKRDLRVEIARKLSEEERQKVLNKIEEVKRILYENSSAYSKKSFNPEQHDKIQEALCELEELMTTLMEEHNMYGNKRDDEGL
jgi:hypothetical protein